MRHRISCDSNQACHGVRVSQDRVLAFGFDKIGWLERDFHLNLHVHTRYGYDLITRCYGYRLMTRCSGYHLMNRCYGYHLTLIRHVIMIRYMIQGTHTKLIRHISQGTHTDRGTRAFAYLRIGGHVCIRLPSHRGARVHSLTFASIRNFETLRGTWPIALWHVKISNNSPKFCMNAKVTECTRAPEFWLSRPYGISGNFPKVSQVKRRSVMSHIKSCRTREHIGVHQGSMVSRNGAHSYTLQHSATYSNKLRAPSYYTSPPQGGGWVGWYVICITMWGLGGSLQQQELKELSVF